jgi:hypothetical protein
MKKSITKTKLVKVLSNYVMVGVDSLLFVPCLKNANHFIIIVVSFEEAHVDVYDPMDKTYDSDVDGSLSTWRVLWKVNGCWTLI